MIVNKVHTYFQYLISAAVVAITSMAIFFSETNIGSTLVEYNVHIMLGLLALGFGALAINYSKVMFTSLAACMVLCIFLKNASNNHMILPSVNTEANISIAHFNVNNIQYLDDFVETISAIDADVLSFQELTPDWNYILKEKLKNRYPYSKSIVRIDPYGMALYSKTHFARVDTFLFDKKPNIEAEMVIDDQPILILGSYLMPSTISKNSSEITKDHLDLISYKIRNRNSPAIALGDYNMVYWANAISRFRDKAQVIHSRRDIHDAGLKPPYDHIFFTTDLECTKFENLNDNHENHIGILGVYQIKQTTPNIESELPNAISSLDY